MEAEGQSGAGTSRVVETEPESVRLTLVPRKKPKWADDTVDNEHLGRKKSKKCCIFHKKKRFDESSDESDTSGDEDDHINGKCNDICCVPRPLFVLPEPKQET